MLQMHGVSLACADFAFALPAICRWQGRSSLSQQSDPAIVDGVHIFGELAAANKKVLILNTAMFRSRSSRCRLLLLLTFCKGVIIIL